MAVLLLLGIPASESRKTPAHIAARVVEVAAVSRADVAVLLAGEASMGDDRLPLDAYDEREQQERKRSRRARRRRRSQ